MGTKIEWTEATWNPVTGCTPVSAGCANCYARRMATRFAGRNGYPADEPFRVTLHPGKLADPLRWKKPRRVFVCSMGDLFHERVAAHTIAQVWAAMAVCPEHIFQVLTKRPQQMHDWLTDNNVRGMAAMEAANMVEDGDIQFDAVSHAFDKTGCLSNVWLGVSIEDQATADERIPLLLQCPAAVRFASYEPALGPVDLYGEKRDYLSNLGRRNGPVIQRGLDWVIAGGESGPGARPAHPDWFRSVRDQCAEAGVPFFFKQWGEWLTWEEVGEKNVGGGIVSMFRDAASGCDNDDVPIFHGLREHEWDEYGGATAYRVGKKRSGRRLDGREHNGMPEGTP